jgi:hypothetical protein
VQHGVVANDATTAIGIRQTGDDAGFARSQDFRGIGIEHALVMALAVFAPDFLDHRVQ